MAPGMVWGDMPSKIGFGGLVWGAFGIVLASGK